MQQQEENKEKIQLLNNAFAASEKSQYQLIDLITAKIMAYLLNEEHIKAAYYINNITKIFQDKQRPDDDKKNLSEQFFITESMNEKHVEVSYENIQKNFKHIVMSHTDTGATFFNEMYETIKDLKVVIPVLLTQKLINMENLNMVIDIFNDLLKMQFQYLSKLQKNNNIDRTKIQYQKIYTFFEKIFKSCSINFEKPILLLLLHKESTELNRNLFISDNFLKDDHLRNKILFFIQHINIFYHTKLTIHDFQDPDKSVTIKNILRQAEERKKVHGQLCIPILNHQITIINSIIKNILFDDKNIHVWNPEIVKLVPESLLQWFLDLKNYRSSETPFDIFFIPEKLFTEKDKNEWEEAQKQVNNFQFSNFSSKNINDQLSAGDIGLILRNIISLRENIGSHIRKKHITLSTTKKPDFLQLNDKKLSEKLPPLVSPQSVFNDLPSYFIKKVIYISKSILTEPIHYIEGNIISIEEDSSELKSDHYNISIVKKRNWLVGSFGMIDFYIKNFLSDANGLKNFLQPVSIKINDKIGKKPTDKTSDTMKSNTIPIHQTVPKTEPLLTKCRKKFFMVSIPIILICLCVVPFLYKKLYTPVHR